MQATATITESPAISAPRDLEVGDTLLRDVRVHTTNLFGRPSEVGTYAAKLTLTMEHLGAPCPIWIWRVQIVAPRYTGAKRTFMVRIRDRFEVPGSVYGPDSANYLNPYVR